MIIKYLTNTYEIKKAYKKISLNAKGAKVKIEPCDDDFTKLVLFEGKKRAYEFFIEEDTLTIKPKKNKWYDRLRIGIDRSEIKLCLPKIVLEDIKINSNTGQVDIFSISCNGVIDIKINTGKVNLEDVYCKVFNSKGNTGYLSLKKLTATESISIKRGAGKVLLKDCSSRDIFVKTNTGSVIGNLPTNTSFICKTNTGKIETPTPIIGKAITTRCEIKTNTGSIKFE